MVEPVSILIVDDEDSVLENHCIYLEDEGFNLQVATTGTVGLQRLQEHSVDLVLVDVRLPDMSGDDFIRQAYEQRPHLSFIIHTGSLEYELPKDLLAIGIKTEHLLFKPVLDMKGMVSLIHQQLKLRFLIYKT